MKLTAVIPILLIAVTINASGKTAPSGRTVEYVFEKPVQVVPCYDVGISYDKPSDADGLIEHFATTADIVEMPAGTKARLLETYYPHYGQTRYWVKAAFEDGSVGYVPTILFAKETTLYVSEGQSLASDKGKVPAGQYKVTDCGPFRYYLLSKGQKMASIDVLPSYIILKRGGKSYRLNLKVEVQGQNFLTRSPSPMYSCVFDEQTTSLLLGLPVPPDWQKVWPRLRFKPGADLNRLCGLSAMEVRSILGTPSARISHSMSRIDGYAYDLFGEVIWRRGKQLYAKGIRVWYDETMTVRYVDEYQTDWCSSDFKGNSAQLFLPWFRVGEKDVNLPNRILNSSGITFKYRPSADNKKTNKSVNLKLPDRIKYYWMYFCENIVGTVSPLAIVGIIIGILLLVNLLIALWIRFGFNYGSNGWVVAKCFLWELIPLAWAIIYVFRWPLLIAVFFGVIVTYAGISALLYFSSKIDDLRCQKCHKWIKPIQINAKGGKFRGTKYHKTNREVLLDRSVYGDSETRVYKVETVMDVEQDMTYTLKCPECGHIWDKQVTESRPSVRGPILRLIVTTTTKRWEEITKTVTEYRHPITSELLDRTEDTRSETHSSTRTDIDEHYDSDRYFPYFVRHINDDKGAIDEYYDKYWDSFR